VPPALPRLCLPVSVIVVSVVILIVGVVVLIVGVVILIVSVVILVVVPLATPQAEARGGGIQ
jgi:hypothetical protein